MSSPKSLVPFSCQMIYMDAAISLVDENESTATNSTTIRS